MMLPSGNDAAQSLGIYFGNLVDIMMHRGDKPPDVTTKSSKNKNLDLIDANINEEEYPDSESDEEI